MPEPSTTSATGGLGPDAPRRPMPFIALAQPVGALSRVSDLARGRPDGEALRACLVGTGLAREAGLSRDEQRAAYWTTLLRFVGCAATSTEYARFAGGDDRAVRRSGTAGPPATMPRSGPDCPRR